MRLSLSQMALNPKHALHDAGRRNECNGCMMHAMHVA
jgi:hypothetical protein